MKDSDIFIVGANGQLGMALRQQYPDAKYADIDKLDITSKESVENFDWSGIKYIINAAAYTNVDDAETEEGRCAAWAVNADAAANLVAVAARYDATLVHISTDYVFDGTIDGHLEEEGFAPLSVYGASKAAGDIAVSLAPKFYIVRTSWVIGEGKNFVRTMRELAEKGIKPSVVNDQIGRLTFTSELVRAIDHLLLNNARHGTYNVTNDGDSVSWADIAKLVYKLSGKPEGDVAGVTTTEYYQDKEGIAPRPLKSTLKLDKIKSTGFVSRDWVVDLKDYVKKESATTA